MMMNNGENGSTNSGGGGPCGACKYLRRKCRRGCIFAPYFVKEQGSTHFEAVHKVFGASNVSKILSSIPIHQRLDAVFTISYEALARIRDPVYGCVGHIFHLQQQVVNLWAELTFVQAHLATLKQPSQATITSPQSSTMVNIHSSSNMISSSNVTAQISSIQSQRQSTIKTTSFCSPTNEDINIDSGDLQTLAREFVHS